ncbi:hypothetical protein GC177_09380 [bacterium]|nr:hypothetical protein [bacterium]
MGLIAASVVNDSAAFESFVIPKAYLDEALWSLLALIALMTGLMAGKRPRLPTLPWLFAMFAYSIFMASGSGLTVPTLAISLFLLVKPMLVAVSTEWLPPGRNRAEQAERAVYAALVALCVGMFVTVFALDIVMPENPIPGTILAARLGFVPARGLFPHPFYVGIIGLFLSVYFLSRHQLLRQRQDLVLAVMAVILVILSSRIRMMMFVPVAVFFLVMTITYLEGRWKRASGYLVFGGMLVAVLLVATLGFFSREVSLYTDPAEAVRTKMFFVALQINWDSFGFGLGPGNFGSVGSTREYSSAYYLYDLASMWGAFGENVNHLTDQWWSWYLGEVGIYGTLIFVGFILFYMWRMLRMVVPLYARYPSLSALALCTSCMCLYGLLVGAVETFFHGAPAGYLVFIGGSLCMMAYRSLPAMEADETAARITGQPSPAHG